MSVSEPSWTSDDLLVALASRRAQRAPRGPHGILLSEASDPKNQFKFRVESEDDFAARALHYQQELWRKRFPDADPSAKLWRVILDD